MSVRASEAGALPVRDSVGVALALAQALAQALGDRVRVTPDVALLFRLRLGVEEGDLLPPPPAVGERTAVAMVGLCEEDCVGLVVALAVRAGVTSVSVGEAEAERESVGEGEPEREREGEGEVERERVGEAVAERVAACARGAAAAAAAASRSAGRLPPPPLCARAAARAAAPLVRVSRAWCSGGCGGR